MRLIQLRLGNLTRFAYFQSSNNNPDYYYFPALTIVFGVDYSFTMKNLQNTTQTSRVKMTGFLLMVFLSHFFFASSEINLPFECEFQIHTPLQKAFSLFPSGLGNQFPRPDHIINFDLGTRDSLAFGESQ